MAAPTIRTTHVGSLPRSDRLRALLTESGDRDEQAFEAAVTESIREVARRQAEIGIDVGNDGEQSRIAYSVDVTNRLSGFGEGAVERAWPADLDDFPAYAEELLGDTENIGGPVATGPIEYVGEEALRRDLARFDEAVDAENVAFPARFRTAPSPGAVLRFTETEHHDTLSEYIFDLAGALQTEYELIAETGAILQIDAPDLLAGFTLTYKDDSVADFRERARTHVEALNEAVANVPDEQIRLHACWGNYPGPHHHDVALEDVIDVFYEADIGGLVVEGANPRHQHEYRTFEEHPLPDGWRLIPGVIDVKTNVVEHPEAVADRLERFADAVGDPERIVAGADCGFETVVEGANAVHPSIAWKKLEALVDGAELASERLA
ncbi:cobalamin-independent methionine synthase II family protein [Halobellus inordinatus]|uniref:cobalamin-independent methionine synthase II family protein n=1 Tax=Halobellus inordinatus TaxID=1126236 RepID=UPI00210AFE99|nr:cobalamin-independent methionine synthase II family protein [Halobellus inordinatus]